MSCTTILVGKKASWDGSTMMARNEDAGGPGYNTKRFVSVKPAEQPVRYVSVKSGVEIDLPDNPMRYTSMPNADEKKEGIWGECGFNEENVGMTATETITSNPRVLSADPLVPGGIGEEDLVTVVLPYIHSAREGVKRLGELLETYGTYEKNGIGFQDAEEVWWFESIGGHHYIAKRVPDDACAVIPNRQGIDSFDFKDALGPRRDHMCSPDLPEFIEKGHLDLSFHKEELSVLTDFDVRAAFGSHTDADHVYNTPRAWDIFRRLNPDTYRFEGEDADFTPFSDDIPWCMVPERKVTVEDIKYALSSHFQGTDYDPYNARADRSKKGMLRPVGVNRTNFIGITAVRPYVPKEIAAVEWVAFGSNVFNAPVPFYANVDDTPAYLKDTTERVTTENMYWESRIIATLADAHYKECLIHVERFQDDAAAAGHAFLRETDAMFEKGITGPVSAFLEERNGKMAQLAREKTDALLDKVLCEGHLQMLNAFKRSDA